MGEPFKNDFIPAECVQMLWLLLGGGLIHVTYRLRERGQPAPGAKPYSTARNGGSQRLGRNACQNLWTASDPKASCFQSLAEFSAWPSESWRSAELSQPCLLYFAERSGPIAESPCPVIHAGNHHPCRRSIWLCSCLVCFAHRSRRGGA